ncbi:helix-turn-helix domain-containing protein [Salibacterium qingdaonense]|uniref:Helix-turn-helix n=1 Tax=Salibacterium qingdaonense TaxID=266892 RepID=A0A1I4QX10_9BACI|nr:helix-turn-helix transcriptional regulator [Salibacterium qingdaonense]SFM44226.1 Helix-turn-helix [Salibacterium qingdaonense]
MKTGEVVAQARKERDLSQQELSELLNVSRESVSQYETGRGTIPEDLRTATVKALDDPQVTIAMWAESTGGVSVPYLDGPMIDHHPAALMDLAKKELHEAEASLEDVPTTKPLSMFTDEDVKMVRKSNKELLDAAAVILTQVADNCKLLRKSFSREIKEWITTLIARKYITRRNV